MRCTPDRRLVLAGLALSAATPGRPLGQAAGGHDRPGYLVVTGRSFDAARIRQYGAALPAVYAAHDGVYLGLGGPGRGVSWIEGPWRDRSLVLAAFPSQAAVETFWWSPAYRAAVPLRDRAGVFTVAAVEGAGPVPFQGAGSAFLLTFLSTAGTDPARIQLAAAAHRDAVTISGGVMMGPADGTSAVMALEGDSVFDRIWICGWADPGARTAFLASAGARAARRARRSAGPVAVATLDGIGRTPQPPV